MSEKSHATPGWDEADYVKPLVRDLRFGMRGTLSETRPYVCENGQESRKETRHEEFQVPPVSHQDAGSQTGQFHRRVQDAIRRIRFINPPGIQRRLQGRIRRTAEDDTCQSQRECHCTARQPGWYCCSFMPTSRLCHLGSLNEEARDFSRW